MNQNHSKSISDESIEKKCGYIALIGSANAGKSTLLNACLRKKISIVSNKPQTTRKRILGIVTQNETQMLFLDTPGLMKNLSSPHSALASAPWDACKDADVICYLIDATRGWYKQDFERLKSLAETSSKKIFVLGTKTDKIKKHTLSQIAQEFQKNMQSIENATFHECMMSSKKPEDVENFLSMLEKHMPQSEWLYDKESRTDCTQTFMCAELIREQIFRQLGEELPYQSEVVIEKFENHANSVHIYATIKVARESQKAIIIGSGGQRLKEIGQLARESLEKYLDQKVFLKTHVKKGNV